MHYMTKTPVVTKDEILKDWAVALDECSTNHEYDIRNTVVHHPTQYDLKDVFELRLQHIWLRMCHSCGVRQTDNVFLSRFKSAIDPDVLQALTVAGYTTDISIIDAISKMQAAIAIRGVSHAVPHQ